MNTNSHAATSHATYRFKFDADVIQAITSFAKIHQYDDRHTYKEAWLIWKDNNSDIVECETNRLSRLGYTGSVDSKMYNAGRYYFRKKDMTVSNDKQEQKQERRVYIQMDPDVLVAMDAHIKEYMDEDEFSPAWGYSCFCKENITIIREEILRMSENGILNHTEIAGKFKKTYNNRYYTLSRNRV